MFRKPGRPPEDRLQRRREIWAAVGPLIERRGARNLSMRQAAAAAFVSLGGLYFYFPNKQALVLFGIDGEVLGAACAEFKTQTRNLLESDPPSAAEAFIRFFAESASFIRPALLAALELGADEFMSRLETFLSIGIEDFVETLRFAVPDAEDQNLRAVARSVRRLVLAGLLDRSMTQKELEEELRALVSGVPIGRAQLLPARSSA